MPYADVNGQRIHYTDSGGDRMPLILAHGFLMDHEMFAPQVAALTPKHRVIAWDERGHGETVTTPDDFSYWDSADDLRLLMDELGIAKAVVGGMSQGGFISLRLALNHPERVAGLVLIDTQAGLEREESLPEYEAMTDVWATEGPNDTIANITAAIIIGNDRPESAYWIAKWMARPKEEVRQIFRTLVTRDDITGRLGEIRAPALVIHGGADAAIDMDRAETLCGGLQGCEEVVVIPGAGHAANLTHPEPVNRAIEAFLERVGA
jgi:3-oxoadipate enol-lactonase